MTDEEIAKIYSEGNAISHTKGLRAVYNAGANPPAEPVTPVPATPAKPFDEMTNDELRAYLDANDVIYASHADKADLERAAKKVERKAKA